MKVMQIHKQTHFSLFALPVSFDIDLAELTQRYRDLQKAVHPDRFANGSEQERLFAIQRAAQVNDGYAVLKSPLLRAQYLLALNDVVADGNATISDPEFLMQQMDMRESLESASVKDDALTVVENTLDEIEGIYRALLNEIKQMFADVAPDYAAINNCVLKLQFFNRLKNEAETMLATIENK
ncbi:MAG: Fe-S protein assembly co-chaperone HscB [Gammaproteobacteria bacterium]|nr:Fe-S protein assembly co-chaperone HscB [Gammaproteobacteria bacterium]